MAINTKRARREAEQRFCMYSQSYVDRWTSLYHNSVEVENVEDSVPKRYLLRVLYEYGAIAFDRETKMYLPFTAHGIDVYGLPTAYTLVGYDGTVLNRSAEQVVILRANDNQNPLKPYFEMQANKIAMFDTAIEQNLNACRYMTIAEVEDDSQLLSVANEVEARSIGATVVYKNKSASMGAVLNTQSTGATYLIDKMQEARKQIINETLSTIGVSVANTEKKERVQSMEVMASRGYALDSINTLIDTFNYDSEQGGLQIRLKGNTSLIEQVEDTQELIEQQGVRTDNEIM